MMRYLGLDLGIKTLGVAISDKTNTFASPLELIEFNKEDYVSALEKVMVIIDKYNIDIVILGLPKNMDNSLGFAAQRSLNFKSMLEEKNIKCILMDERLSSVESINILKSNNVKRINKSRKVDILSAVLILEEYLKKVKYEEQNSINK